MNNWTKKHDEWCLFFGLRPSTQLLYRWIHRKTKGHSVKEVEIDEVQAARGPCALGARSSGVPEPSSGTATSPCEPRSAVRRRSTLHLRDFNQWISKKRGRPYDRKTLKTAYAQLRERTEGLIVQQKEITWFYRKLIVKPITFLSSEKKPKKELCPQAKSPKPSWHSHWSQVKEIKKKSSKLNNRAKLRENRQLKDFISL